MYTLMRLVLGLQLVSWGLMLDMELGHPYFNNCTSEPKCRCFVRHIGALGRELGADCSNRNIHVAPVFSPEVTWISISNNAISRFPKTSDIGYYVDFLDLSNNNLRSFRKDTLQKLSRLIVLDLKNNKLHYDVSIFMPGLFESLTNLQFLNLKENVQKQDTEYPRSIGDLTALRYLQLDGIDGVDFPEEYQNISNLTTLDLSSRTGYCQIKSLTTGMFRNVAVIQHLNVSFCKLTRIERDAISVLSRLVHLNISNNVYLSFSVFSNLSWSLQFMDIRTLDVSKVHCTYGVGTYILVEDVNYLNNTRLERLYIDSNRLSMLESDTLNYLPPTLTYISTRDNLFTMGIYVLQFCVLDNLREFDVSDSFTTHNPGENTNRFYSCGDWRGPHKNGMMLGNEAMLRDNVNFKRFRDWREPQKMFENEALLRDNVTVKLYGDIERGLTFIVNLPRNLEIVSLKKCRYQYVISSLHFAENKVTRIYAQDNMFVEWRGPIYNLTRLEYVDLSNNFCSYVATDFFRFIPTLKTLIIHTNLLGFMIYRDSKGETFQYNTRMIKLDISMNRINSLPRKIFHTLSNMQELNVSFNLMSSLQADIGHMTNLRYLDLSFNQLPELTEQNRHDIDRISRTSGNLTIDLSSNRLFCSCQTLPFLRWITLNQRTFKRFETYHCSLENATTVSFSDVDAVLRQLEKDCTSYLGLIGGLVSAIVFCIAVLVSGLVYRYRWKLRYLYYLTKNKHRGYARVRDDQNHDFQYDAFISYAEEEYDFVKNDFLKNLEEDRNFRLLVHGRDFIPGIDIAANITNAIHSSRKTVVIMSENFLGSYWCMYELNMARMESIYSREGASVLFLVMYRPVPVQDIPLQVMDIIQSKSYIEFPDDPQGNVVFWDKIAEAIAI